jgi:hypothetical protein
VDLYLPLPLRILYTYQLPTYVLGVIILFCVLSSAAMGTAGLLYLLSPFISTRPQVCLMGPSHSLDFLLVLKLGGSNQGVAKRPRELTLTARPTRTFSHRCTCTLQRKW